VTSPRENRRLAESVDCLNSSVAIVAGKLAFKAFKICAKILAIAGLKGLLFGVR